MAIPQEEADITSRDDVKENEATMAVEEERVEVEMVELVEVEVTVEQRRKCSCSKEKISKKQMKALRGRDHKKKTVITDAPPSTSFELRVLPSAAADADIQNNPSQIKSSTFQSDFDVTAATGEVEDTSDERALYKTPSKSFEQTTDNDELLPVIILDTTNNSFDDRAAGTQYSPTSQLEFDVIATRSDDKYSEMDHSHDAYETKRKTQAMKDLDVLLDLDNDDDDDDESDCSTVSLDEENEELTLPEANESKSGNGWLFSCTMDEIDDVVEDLISPLDSITSFISCDRDDSIIIDKIESVCADDFILEHHIDIESEECAD